MPHIHEKIDFTVEEFIVYNNKALLRKHDKYGIWLGVGGHIELNEDPNQAAVREVKEEVGLDVQLYDNSANLEGDYDGELIPPQFMNRHRINDSHEHIALIYFAKTKSDKLVLSETEKSDGCKWFNLNELDNSQYKIKDTIKMYARSALEKLVDEG